MDTENKRVNIDSAKKLAVMQRKNHSILDMDYEGFRQMVLGANIFPTKSKELQGFTKGEPIGVVQVNANKLFDQNKEVIEVMNRAEGHSERFCQNFRDFKKKFMKYYDKVMTNDRAEECILLIKEQNQERIKAIFNLECEANILVKIAEVFTFVLDYLESSKDQRIVD
jgi:polyribonucleotide nucleotidyltransferase